jgi:hypothetical protein
MALTLTRFESQHVYDANSCTGGESIETQGKSNNNNSSEAIGNLESKIQKLMHICTE